MPKPVKRAPLTEEQIKEAQALHAEVQRSISAIRTHPSELRARALNREALDLWRGAGEHFALLRTEFLKEGISVDKTITFGGGTYTSFEDYVIQQTALRDESEDYVYNCITLYEHWATAEAIGMLHCIEDTSLESAAGAIWWALKEKEPGTPLKKLNIRDYFRLRRVGKVP